MIVYLDGDNNPGTREVGIEKLTKFDRLKIFYNAGNGFYGTQESRNRIVEVCRASIEFHELFVASQSTDFAVATDAAAECEKSTSQVIALISGDKHFESILKILRSKYPLSVIKKAPTIAEAWEVLGLLSANGIEDIYKHFIDQFGFVCGGELFDRLAQEFIVLPQRSRLLDMQYEGPLQ